MKRLAFSPAARTDLMEIGRYIADGLRSITHGRYLLFFRDLADEVRIVRVLHGARDLTGVFADPIPSPEDGDA